ncbi:MAG: MBL fold metallo-hydrolase [Chloroflexi bacterium]|nr:MBL fold metallo-hydrolase [Chloroflexota bacterium]MBP8058201.1 MBL fold metallo-hydrolase [Chloroflexota bacterium]
MKQIIPGLSMFTGLLVGRVYCIEDADGLTLIDTGLALAAAKILRQIRQAGRTPQDVKRILITHAHPDHVDGLSALKQATGATVVALVEEQPYIEGQKPVPRAPKEQLHGLDRLMVGNGQATPVTHPVKVDRPLLEGEIMPDVMGGLQALWTPGHSPGHTAYWQAEKGILFCGDVLMRFPGYRLPFAAFTSNMAENKRSLQKIVALQPRLVCFGHGQPLQENAAATLRQFAQKINGQ